MADPLVSILMPTYRRPHYLRQALASAVGQTYKNLQIVPHILPGGLVADVVATLGSLDPVLGDVDR